MIKLYFLGGLLCVLIAAAGHFLVGLLGLIFCGLALYFEQK